MKILAYNDVPDPLWKRYGPEEPPYTPAYEEDCVDIEVQVDIRFDVSEDSKIDFSPYIDEDIDKWMMNTGFKDDEPFDSQPDVDTAERGGSVSLVSLDEDVLNVLESELSNKVSDPGTYRIQCWVEMVYDVGDVVHWKYENYKYPDETDQDSWDYDEADVTLNLEDSNIESFSEDMIQKLK